MVLRLCIIFILCVPYMLCLNEWINCSFENNWCSWELVSVSNKNWTMAKTPSPFIRAPHGEYFLYANTTGFKKGAKSVLSSPNVGINGNVCMKFYVNALAMSPGNLLVKLGSDKGNSLQLTINSFQRKFWQCVYVPLEVTERTRISIEMEDTGANVPIIGLDWIQFVDPASCTKQVCSNMDIDPLDSRLANIDNAGPVGPPGGDPNKGGLNGPTETTPVQTTLQMIEPTSAQIESDLTQWLPTIIAIPVCFVVVTVILLIWCFRYCKKKRQKETAEQKLENISSKLAAMENTKEVPLTEEDEYGYVSITAVNSDVHYYSTMKDPKDIAIPRDHSVKSSDVRYTYDDYMKPRNMKTIDGNRKFSHTNSIDRMKEDQTRNYYVEPLDDNKIPSSHTDYNGYIKPRSKKRNTYIRPLDENSAPPPNIDYSKPRELSDLSQDGYIKPREMSKLWQDDYMKPRELSKLEQLE